MEWELIKTAPKDGTFILAYGPGLGMAREGYTIVSWCSTKNHRMGHPYWSASVAGWQVYLDSDLGRDTQPTHWMPLPHPPQR